MKHKIPTLSALFCHDALLHHFKRKTPEHSEFVPADKNTKAAIMEIQAMMPITMPAMAPLERLKEGPGVEFAVALIVGELVARLTMLGGEELAGVEVEEEEELVVVAKSMAG